MAMTHEEWEREMIQTVESFMGKKVDIERMRRKQSEREAIEKSQNRQEPSSKEPDNPEKT